LKKYLTYVVISGVFFFIGLLAVPMLIGEVTNNLYEKSSRINVKSLILAIFNKYRILNFMVVGGIGYAVNMGLYYPLTLVFKNEVTFLGQHFYLPPFVISSLVAIVCNYYMNKIWTFADRIAKSMSLLRYLSMAIATLFLDMLVLFALVEYGKLAPILGAALAILIVFIVRYIIASNWIWHRKY
jgi:putative flippase GtrA